MLQGKNQGRNNQLGGANAMEMVEPCILGNVIVVVENCESMNAVEVVERTDINLKQTPRRNGKFLKHFFLLFYYSSLHFTIHFHRHDE
jgi:hypothetical protein